MEYILISVLLMCMTLSYGAEPQCIQMSRFDYEYKMLQTLTECEMTTKDLQSKFKDNEMQFRDLNAKISNYENLERRVVLLEKTNGQKGNGVTYVRWGRTTCPGNGTDLVYAGYLGGSHNGHKGAAANHLCLPKNPDWDHYEENVEAGAKVYGGEYELDIGSGFGKAIRFFGKAGLDEQKPVCAVCVSARPSYVMIPGKNTCSDGWTKEYSGYLVAGYRGHEAATQYICLDRHPEIGNEGKSKNLGQKLYFVDGECGSLPCPPYVQGRELTCVVCTN